MLWSTWNILTKNLEDVKRLCFAILSSKELLMGLLLLLGFTLDVTAGWFRGSHVELGWRGVYEHKVVLTRIVIHILLYVIVGLLNVYELLSLEIVIINCCVVIIVILYLDVLGLGALSLLTNWRAWVLAFTSHLRAHVRAWRRRTEYLVIWHEEIVEVVL